jgi:alkylation response protein AidB-like acyl-CoA dehydrogenase
MEYRFSDQALAFEAEVNEFLSQEWTPELRATIGDPTTDTMTEERGFRKLLAERGWLTMSWPKEYGGQERSLEEQYLFWEAMNYVGAPQATVATQQVGPTLMRFGTDEQQERFLPPIARGEVEFALGYSEPDAGSDLASLQLRAVKDGDDYVLNGIKRFTSGAHRSEYVWLATRTDPDAPKHRGITYLLVDMKTPGITVRPLINMLGGHGFNEVFFEDVRVPVDNRVGEENRGWYVGMATMDFERSALSGSAALRRNFEDFIGYLSDNPATERRVKVGVADTAINIEVSRMLSLRVLSMQQGGLAPNHEASVAKMFSSELSQRFARFGVNVMGQFGGVRKGDPYSQMQGWFTEQYMSSVPATIAGGSSEIQRGIIATRGLGLPRA